jgi:methylenetetrahydrofolate reductase (NADPH)
MDAVILDLRYIDSGIPGSMARRLQASLPGLSIPASVIEALDKAADPAQQGIALAGRIIRDLQGLCQGGHLITIGQERYLPRILQEAGLMQGV